MLAVLAVSIASNLINVLISVYYSYEAYSVTQVFSGLFTAGTVTADSFALRNQAPMIQTVTIIKGDTEAEGTSIVKSEGTTQVGVSVFGTGEEIILSQTFLDALKDKEGWIQLIDSEGIEIESINKPDTIKTYYTREELDKAANGPMKMDEYVAAVSMLTTDDSNKVAMVVGLPRPDVNLKTMMSRRNELSSLPGYQAICFIGRYSSGRFSAGLSPCGTNKQACGQNDRWNYRNGWREL